MAFTYFTDPQRNTGTEVDRVAGVIYAARSSWGRKAEAANRWRRRRWNRDQRHVARTELRDTALLFDEYSDWQVAPPEPKPMRRRKPRLLSVSVIHVQACDRRYDFVDLIRLYSDGTSTRTQYGKPETQVELFGAGSARRLRYTADVVRSLSRRHASEHADMCVPDPSYPCKHNRMLGHGLPVCDRLPLDHTPADHAAAVSRRRF